MARTRHATLRALAGVKGGRKRLVDAIQRGSPALSRRAASNRAVELQRAADLARRAEAGDTEFGPGFIGDCETDDDDDVTTDDELPKRAPF